MGGYDHAMPFYITDLSICGQEEGPGTNPSWISRDSCIQTLEKHVFPNGISIQMGSIMCNHKKLKSGIETSTMDSKIGHRWVPLKGDLRGHNSNLSQCAGQKISPPKTTRDWKERELACGIGKLETERMPAF